MPLDVSKAKKQLATRLKTLKWAAEAFYSEGTVKFVSIGRIFVLKLSDAKKTLNHVSADGISYYIHKL